MGAGSANCASLCGNHSVPSLAACPRARPKGFSRTCQGRGADLRRSVCHQVGIQEKPMSGIGMSKNMKLVHIAAIVAVAAFICATAFVIKATPPSGISFSPVGRATVPEFSVKRKDKALDWAIRLDTDQPIDVATQIVTFQPGGFSGW